MRDQRTCLGKTDYVVDDLDYVFSSDRPHVLRQVQAQLLVELVAPHPRQVVTAGIEEVRVHQAHRRIVSRRVAGPDSVVDVYQSLFGIMSAVEFERGVDVAVGNVNLDLVELELFDPLGNFVVDSLAGLGNNLVRLRIPDLLDRPETANGIGRGLLADFLGAENLEDFSWSCRSCGPASRLPLRRCAGRGASWPPFRRPRCLRRRSLRPSVC